MSANGLCVDDKYASMQAGNPIWIYDCNGTPAQSWTYENGTFQVLGSCMDLSGGASTAGTPIVLQPCDGSPTQQWTISGSTIVDASGLCLDIPGDDDVSQQTLQVWNCNGTPAQNWTFDGTSGMSGGCGSGSGSGGGSVSDGGGSGGGGSEGGGGSSSGAPPQAAAVGYTTNTFSSTLSQSTVDVNDTRQAGLDWYLGQFFGSPSTPSSDLAFDSDGTLTLNGVGTSSNAGINSAAPASNAAGWVGTAFGGGAYFEAVFSFDPQDTINANGNGWPSWWAMAIEHLAGLPAEQWPGQPSSYEHFIETDFFEYDVWGFSPHNEYGGTLHDWYGIWPQSCGSYCNANNAPGGGSSFGNFQVQTPSSTDFTQDHAFGFLWVPATASSEGYGQFYFDGQATNDRVTWSQYSGSDAPPPGSAPWTFGILDQQHVVLTLGTGASEPMRIRSVNVWQASAANNLVQ